MKTLEEIERLSPEELENMAAAQGGRAPRGLQRRIEAALAADELVRQETARKLPVRRKTYAALCAVAAAAALLLALPQRGPRDTFDDPQLACAEVEKVFRTIADKMSAGMDLARQAQELADKPQYILDKTLSR